MSILALNFIFCAVNIIIISFFGQRYLFQIHNIKRIKKIAKMPGAKLGLINKKLKKMNEAIFKMQKISYILMAIIPVIHVTILFFHLYIRPIEWIHPWIISSVSLTFMWILYWMKGASIISHLNIEDDLDTY